mmetsp:Transcript_110771/g.346575  ORF Transcript_110771/g.346575 Transcript_110771/m.346575 type:complete len:282 (-) Transcript_110771:59-904(-)
MAAQVHFIWGSVETPSHNNSSSTDASSLSTGNDQSLNRRPLHPALRIPNECVKLAESSSSAKSAEPSASASARVAGEPTSSCGSSHKAKRALAAEIVAAHAAHEAAAQQGPAPAAEASGRNEENEEGEEDEEEGGGRRVPAAQPLLDAAELWSKGSALHSSSKCRPCHYVHTSLGCMNGRNCTFCHLPHTGKNRPRPSKAKRLLCKNMANTLEDMTNQDSSQFTDVMKTVASQSSYMRGILKKRLKEKQGKAASAAEPGSASAGQPPQGRAPHAGSALVSL